MGRKRKLSSGVIVTIYLENDQYIQLLSNAHKQNKSISEYIRGILSNILALPQTQIDGGNITNDLQKIKNDLLLDEAKQKFQTIKNLSEKLRNLKPSDRITLQYFQMKQTWKKLTMELIEFIEKNQNNLDQKFIGEVREYLKHLAF
jgi:hypothetical protein